MYPKYPREPHPSGRCFDLSDYWSMLWIRPWTLTRPWISACTFERSPRSFLVGSALAMFRKEPLRLCWSYRALSVSSLTFFFTICVPYLLLRLLGRSEISVFRLWRRVLTLAYQDRQESTTIGATKGDIDVSAKQPSLYKLSITNTTTMRCGDLFKPYLPTGLTHW